MAKTLPAGAPPAAPSELNGTALSCNRAELVWNDNSDNEDGLRLKGKKVWALILRLQQLHPIQLHLPTRLLVQKKLIHTEYVLIIVSVIHHIQMK